MNTKKSFILFSVADILFFSILNYINMKLDFVIKINYLLVNFIFLILFLIYIFIKNKKVINNFIYNKKIFIISFMFIYIIIAYILSFLIKSSSWLKELGLIISLINIYLFIYCFILTLYIIALKIRKSVEKNKPKQILYICPHCGAYTTVLQENIKNANPQCSFCETNRILINEKPTKDKRKFENHILTTYLKNYPQFDENLYLERISKEQRK